MYKSWQVPDALHRSFPFWAWNGKLNKEELIRQVRLMKEAGVGGFFIHSREGLETEYLGHEWMECVRAVVDEAKRQGMYVWLYDEDRFPSGTAGGKVPACGDAFRCKGLTLQIQEVESYPDLFDQEIFGKDYGSDDHIGIQAVYGAVVGDQDKVLSIRRLAMKQHEAFLEGEVLLVVQLEVSASSEWFNFQSPPDNLNPECVERFIMETHEKYKAVIGDEFGKTVLGIFTDEPSLHDRHAFFGEKKGWIPWTYGLGTYFKELNGYDFLDFLPYMYFRGEYSKRTRRDYWHMITLRFGETFFKRIGDWCKDNNIMFTGHFLQEDKIGLCTRVNGAAMPDYQYQQVPGIDMLCEQTNEYMTVKQCTSVANQLDKKWVLSETYGCTGWDFTFEGQKWMGDWQFVLGVNRRCQHLALYSLRGCSKRDYPPSFHYNTNWWRENKWIEDYFSRLSLLLEQGKAVRNVLIIHPASRVWSRLGTSPYGNPVRRNERDVPGLNAYGDQLNQLIEYLERNHMDLDLGDELLIRQYGSTGQGKFQIGSAEYPVVIVPPDMDSMLEDTNVLLREFVADGGCLIYMTHFTAPGGKISCESQETVNFIPGSQIVENREKLIKYLEPYHQVFIQNRKGEECKDILYQLRKVKGGYILFLVNNSRVKEVDANIRLPFNSIPIEMGLFDGKIKEAPIYNNGTTGVNFHSHFERSGSTLYFLKAIEVKKTFISGPLPYRLDHDNVLPLDMCQYRLKGQPWSGTMEVWKAQKEVRYRLGMRQIVRNGLEQRYRWINPAELRERHRLNLRFDFDSSRDMRNLRLALERSKEFRIKLNRIPIESKKKGYFLDREFETIEISHIRKGKNQLELSCDYREDMELENIYLLGEFGVSPERRLIKLQKMLPFGDWAKQGLKHYCGSVSWVFVYQNNEVDARINLKVPGIEGVCAIIRINDAEIPLLCNGPKELSIEEYIKYGLNKIEVEVMGSPRNMMGPFHLKEKPYSTKDSSFSPTPSEYSSHYLLTPYGIMGDLQIMSMKIPDKKAIKDSITELL